MESATSVISVVLLLVVGAGARSVEAMPRQLRNRLTLHLDDFERTSAEEALDSWLAEHGSGRQLPLKKSAPPPTYISMHNQLVKNSLLRFRPVLSADDLPVDQRHSDSLTGNDLKASFAGVSAPTEDPLDHLRQRDRLLLFRPEEKQDRRASYGAALFGATTVMAAHLPEPLRVIVDGRVHLGPAVLGDGAFGAGVGGVMR